MQCLLPTINAFYTLIVATSAGTYKGTGQQPHPRALKFDGSIADMAKSPCQCRPDDV